MDSVELYDSSLNVQLVHYEQTVSELQDELDDLLWSDLPQSTITELGHLADYVLNLLREAEQENRLQHYGKAQQKLKTLSLMLVYFRQLLKFGNRLCNLKIHLEQLVKYGFNKYRPLVGYQRILIRKYSVVVGMARLHQETCGRQLEELRQGLEDLEGCLGNHSLKNNRTIVQVPRTKSVNKKIIAAQAG